MRDAFNIKRKKQNERGMRSGDSEGVSKGGEMLDRGGGGGRAGQGDACKLPAM